MTTMTMTYIDNRAPVGRPVSIDELEAQRASLVRHCQRILGSAADAEDAVQETLMRAWRKLDGFECRTSVRAWLRRIATNVCLDMLRGSSRRTVAADLGPSSAAASGLADLRSPDPGTSAESKESVERAFVTALQHLPARQRAVLILHDVLRWRAREIAELLDHHRGSSQQRPPTRPGDDGRVSSQSVRLGGAQTRAASPGGPLRRGV